LGINESVFFFPLCPHSPLSSCQSFFFCDRAGGQDGRHGHHIRNRDRPSTRGQARDQSHGEARRCCDPSAERLTADGKAGREDGRVRDRAHRCHQEARRPGSAEAAAGSDESEPELVPEPALAPIVSPGPDTADALAPRSVPSLQSAPPVRVENNL